MDAEMARPQKYESNDLARMSALIVDEMVTSFRNRGFTYEKALKQAASAMDRPFRRVRALFYGQEFVVLHEEYNTLHSKFLEHLDEQAEYLAAQSAAARARRKEMEKQFAVGDRRQNGAMGRALMPLG